MPDGGWRGATVGGAVAFVFALGLAFLATLVLAIVGAPMGLVDAVAPLAAIFATLAFALLLGAPSLLSFAAVGIQAGVLTTGLAFAIGLGGVVLALGDTVDPASATPVFADGAILAFLVAPRARFGGTLSDVLASRVSFWPLRATFAVAFLAIGALTATAGLVLALGALDEALGGATRFSDALIAGALVLSVASGGARSLVWVDAASAAFVALALAGAAALAGAHGPITAQSAALELQIAQPTAIWAQIGLIAGVATFSPSAISLGASGSSGRALKIAGVGIAFAVAALVLLAIAYPSLARSELGFDPAIRTLLALVGLALARQGLFVAVRAFGFNLRLDPQRIVNTASARLARLRVASLGLCVALVFAARVWGESAPTLMSAALALSLGLIAPALVLNLTTQGSTIASALALVVGIVTLLRNDALPHAVADINLSAAAQGAVVAVLVGFVAARLLPDRVAQEPLGDGLFD